LTESDVALFRLRNDYRCLNESFKTSFAFRFGRGAGFCAEMLGLIKSMMHCLHGRVRLCMSQGGRPVGINIAGGFTDYFEALFPEIDAGLFNALNVQAVRGSGRFPIVRRGVSALLHATTGAERFMMDDPGALPARLVVPELGIDSDYWDACAILARMAWAYRPQVGNEVAGIISGWAIPKSYVSVHVRRGDKNRESPYANSDGYVSAIKQARPEGGDVVIASDDGKALSELAGLLPARYRVIPCSANDARGHRQEEFNRLPAAERFSRLKRFLAELEILRGGELFIGSAGSNVTYLIEMMRAGRGVVQLR